MPTEKICLVSDIPSGEAREFKIKNFDVAIFNVEGKFYAIDRKCTHLKGNLAKGKLEGTSIICPLHGTKFDLKTGKLLSPPSSIAGWFKKASDTIIYKTEVKKNELFIVLPE